MRKLLVAVAFASISCTGGPSSAPSPDASAPTVAKTREGQRVLAALATMPAFADHLGRGTTLVTDASGHRLPQQGFRPTGTSLVVTAPHHANEPLRIADPAGGFSIEIADASLRSAASEVHDGAVVYPGALPDGDIAHVLEPARVEEIRLVRTTGTFTTQYTLHTTGSAEIRLRDGRVEVYDGAGKRRVSSDPMFAVDANGVRRTATLTLGGEGSDRTLTVAFDTTGMTPPIAIDPMWQLTGSGVTTANNAPVAATGPTSAMYFPGTPQSYDAITDTWTTRPATTTNHGSDFTVTLVPSINKLLIAGGSSASSGQSDLYTFGASYSSAATGNMTAYRFAHSAVLLGDGGAVPERVFAVGGRTTSSTVVATTEWWDPGTGTWSARATMAVTRYNPGLAVFTTTGGKQLVLAAGGHDGLDANSTAEVYDPVANTWTSTTNAMPVRRVGHVTVALPGGKVLVAGGQTSTYCCPITETTSIYDASTNAFTAGAAMHYSRSGAAGLLLPNGTVLVAGGKGHKIGTSDADATLNTTEIYDPSTNTWTDGPNLASTRQNFFMVPLSNGRALAVSGISGGGYVGSAEIYYPDPTTCTGTGPGCANCVDGYCCDTACGGQCQACDVAGRQGICSNVNGEAPHGSRAACSPFVSCAYNATTGTSACATTCAGDTACASTSFCSGGTCVAKKANGAACTGDNQCASTKCVDGFCCESACTSQCYACGESGKEGKCVAVDGAPRGTRASCPSGGYGCAAGSCASACTKDSQCVGSNYCNASGACVPKQANGATCTGTAQCSSSICSDGYCCATTCTGTCSACGPSGTCAAVPAGPPPAGKSCGAYANCKAGGTCATSCGSDGDCSSGFFCNATGSCVVRKAAGASCLSSSECTSGSCASGVCCDVACNGECEACNLPGSIGTCKAKSAGTSCGLAGCVGGYTVAVSSCDGASSACPLGAIAPCPNGVVCLDKSSCKSACAADTDCVVGTCDTATGKCVSAWDGGLPDTGSEASVDSGADSSLDSSTPDTSAPDTEPADTFVPDTSTPDTTTSDTLEIADVPDPPFKGETKVEGTFQRCTKGSECATGFCVEGVCCDSPCTDRCHSCALLTSPGKCTLEPVGVDLKSECGPALSCLGTCGPGGECIGSGNGTMCARNRCTGPSTGAGPAYCAAPGAKCNTDEAVPFDCAPYICEPAFGACVSSCATSSDCAQGFVCDIPSKTCVAAAPSGGTSDDGGGGGCALSARQTGASTGAFALLAIALGSWRRRRGRVSPT